MASLCFVVLSCLGQCFGCRQMPSLQSRHCRRLPEPQHSLDFHSNRKSKSCYQLWRYKRLTLWIEWQHILGHGLVESRVEVMSFRFGIRPSVHKLRNWEEILFNSVILIWFQHLQYIVLLVLNISWVIYGDKIRHLIDLFPNWWSMLFASVLPSALKITNSLCRVKVPYPMV